MRAMDRPRPAATVVLVRPGDPGVEVLVERRSADSSFAPGFVVFPGGVVEDEDRRLAEALFRDPSEDVRACAVRELYEETGILLEAGGARAVPERPPLLEALREAPRQEDLAELARWVAPEFLAVRFDAWFYAVAAPPGVEPTPDGVEISDAWWTPPGAIVEASVRGEAPLMWPTLVTLEELEERRSVEEAVSTRIEQIPPPEPGVQPRRGVWLRPEYRADGASR